MMSCTSSCTIRLTLHKLDVMYIVCCETLNILHFASVKCVCCAALYMCRFDLLVTILVLTDKDLNTELD